IYGESTFARLAPWRGVDLGTGECGNMVAHRLGHVDSSCQDQDGRAFCRSGGTGVSDRSTCVTTSVGAGSAAATRIGRADGEGTLNVRGQLVAVNRYTFARIRFFRSSSFTSFARA